MKAKVRDRQTVARLTIPDHTHVTGGYARMASGSFYLNAKAIR
jgi:hypothetical protein